MPRIPESETTLENAAAAGVSRRELLAAGSALAALTASGCTAGATAGTGSQGSLSRGGTVPRAPFDTFRDYITALDAHGLLFRIPEIDQDAFHATALVFHAADRYSMFGAPAYYFDRVRINGQWVDGPLIGNHQGNLHTDAVVFGFDPVPGDGRASYRKAKAHLHEVLAKNGGRYPEIPPVEVSRDKALCKEVILRGDEIDLTRYAFVQTNPADAGRYVNTGSVFMWDPEMGGNFGTYRCQIKGPRLLGLNPEPGQTGWRMLMAARKRGEKTARVSIVLGQDPIVWVISGTRVAPRFGPGPVDELAVAGGFRGRPLEVVKSETNDMLVPAHAEMVIEGEVPLQETGLPEGPFGEMFGYLGPHKEDNFWLNVTTVTHRRNPWIMNAFTGMQRGMVTSPQDALYEHMLRRSIPNLVEMYQPQDTMGVAIMAIDKTAPGQAIAAGQLVAQRNPIAKVIIIVDKDIDVMDRTQVLFALGSRWQPVPATELVKEVFGILTDPSQPVQGKTSKIIIDATRQLPEEGGRADFPATNRALLEKGAPEAMAAVEKLYGQSLKDWAYRLG
jgi:4-hydroxy-3-polyprenylbenzoate decarboxylase